MRQLLDLQQDIKDTTDFAEAMKVDIFDDEVFVFTPKGEVKELPKGATALDFAYAVHTDVGTHCMGVKVNGQMVPLRYVLKNGDIVEVLTQSSRTPSRDWLKIVTTSRAKNKIRHWFRTHLSAEEIDMGKHMLEKEAVRMGMDFNGALKSGALEGVLDTFGCHTVNELLANTGHGEVSPKQILNKLAPKPPPEDKAVKTEKHLKRKKPLKKIHARSGLARFGYSQGPSSQGYFHRRPEGFPHPFRPLLHAGSGGPHCRLRHTRPGSIGAPYRLPQHLAITRRRRPHDPRVLGR